MNNAVRNKCQTSGYHFTDNNNITTETFWKGCINSGKGILPSLNSGHFLRKQPNRQILS